MNGNAKKAGVIGWPLAHSLSPALHTYWMKEHGIDGSYDLMPTTAEDVSAAIASLADKGYVGANITVPHKEVAASIMDRLDPVAEALGAVNLIVIGKGGALEGRNTDGFGFLENVRACAPDVGFEGKRALILGAGGTARAVAHALKGAGVNVAVSNRTQARAESLAAILSNIEVVPWPERANACDGAALLVNATTLGMEGQPPLELDLAGLAEGAVVADCVYAPLETGLLRSARLAGHGTADGLGMLMHQARPAFEAWFGVAPKVTPALRDYLVRAQKEMWS